MDDLSDKLKNSGIGLHIKEEWYNNLMYADDVVLMSPSASGLQSLISICEQYANDHDIIYNTSKTVTMCTVPRRYKLNNLPKFHLCGRELNSVNEYKYLGHYITPNLNDDRDISYRYRDISIKGNIISRMFNKCSVEVKRQIFQTFCSNIYGNHLWLNYTQRILNKLRVCYNNSFRILMGLPFNCSASFMFSSHQLRSFKEIKRFSTNSLMKRLNSSSNNLLNNIVNVDMFYDSRFFKEYVDNSLS